MRISLRDSKTASIWGDWKYVDVSFSSQDVRGFVPAYAGNTLYLFWFEVEERGKQEDNINIELYFLTPKYSRQNADGTFSEPWSPFIDEKEGLNITDYVTDPETYEMTTLMPFLDASGESVVLIFSSLPETRKGFLQWKLSSNSSRNNVTSYEGAFRPHVPHITDYGTIANGLTTTGAFDEIVPNRYYNIFVEQGFKGTLKENFR